MPFGDRLHFLWRAVQDHALALRGVAPFVNDEVRRQARAVRALRAAKPERRSENETEQDAGDAPGPQAASLTMVHRITQRVPRVLSSSKSNHSAITSSRVDYKLNI